MENVAKRRIALGDHPQLDKVIRAVAPGVDGGDNPTVAVGFAVLDGPLVDPPSNEPPADPASLMHEPSTQDLVECSSCHELNQRGAKQCAR
jgi:hypothetical protein